MRGEVAMTIVVTQKQGTAEEVIEAVAKAALGACALREEGAPWEAWEDPARGNCAKLVKRASRGRQEVLLAEVPDAYGYTVGDVLAVALPPCALEDLHPVAAKAQLQGLEREQVTAPEAFAPQGPVVLVDASLPMSTGKQAAQAAHGLTWLWKQLGATTAEAERLQLTPVRFAQSSLMARAVAEGRATVVVQDAGLSEVPPGTRTVVAWA